MSETQPISSSTQGSESPDLSVVVPVHDEAGAILPLLAEIRAALLGILSFEIIVVDDGSRDGTSAELSSVVQHLPELRVVVHSEQQGQSAAIANGVRLARGWWVATLDGDGQNDPHDLRDFWGVVVSDPAIDMVCGVRTQRREGLPRRLASRIANAVRQAVLHDGVEDTGCGIKLFARRAFLGLPRFDHMHRFLPALLVAAGGRTVTRPVHDRPRSKGRSKYGIVDRLLVGVPDLIGVWWLTRRISAVSRGSVRELRGPCLDRPLPIAIGK